MNWWLFAGWVEFSGTMEKHFLCMNLFRFNCEKNHSASAAIRNIWQQKLEKQFETLITNIIIIKKDPCVFSSFKNLVLIEMWLNGL